MCVHDGLALSMYSEHIHVHAPTQLIAKAEAREKERQKAEERKVLSTLYRPLLVLNLF